MGVISLLSCHFRRSAVRRAVMVVCSLRVYNVMPKRISACCFRFHPCRIVQQKMEKKKAREESSESESEEWKARRAVAEPAASSAKRALSSSLPRRKATPGILTSQRPHPLVSFHDLAGSAGEEDEEAQAWRILAALLARGFRGMPQQAAVSGPVAVGGQGHYTRVHPIVS